VTTAVSHLSPQELDDGIVDVSVSKLVLDVVARAHRSLDRRLDGFLEDGTIEQTMTDGAPKLTLVVLDHGLDLLASGAFAYRVDVELDEIPFRLVQVSLGDDEALTLNLEHRVVSWLREHDRPLKVSRGKATRAEFIYRMVREVDKGPIRFVSPELHRKQPIAAPKSSDQQTQRSKDANRDPGFAKSTKVTISNGAASRSQLHHCSVALDVAAGLNAGPKATLAMVCAGIGESSFKDQMNQGGSGYGGVFQGAVNVKPYTFRGVSGVTRTAQQAHYFLVGGKGYQAGGAIALARANPGISPGAIATKVEASGQPASFYDRWRHEAHALIEAYGGGGESYGGGGSYWKRYEFTRGQPGDHKEDSWTAGQRLAQEVRWRLFVVGRRTIFYVTDDDLMRSRPRYLIDPQTTGVAGLTGDVEVGHRTIIVKGRREPKPSEAKLSVRMDRWAAPPGTVIELADYGPFDGRWLVDSTSRPIFDSLGEVNLRQPQKALPEPRSEQGTRGSSSKSSSKRGGVKVAAGANRAGVGLHKALMDFLALVAGQTSEPIIVTTGTNHNQYVAGSHNQSDHWTGDAADIGVGGDARSDPTASTHDWNGHRVQVGWRTMVGGNHYNHVHIGVAPKPAQVGSLDQYGHLTHKPPKPTLDTHNYGHLTAHPPGT
jgi:hypothetical protein